MVPRAVLDASHVDDDGSDLFAVDADPMKRFSVVRALTANGTLVWQATVHGTPWAGDRFGGLLARLGPLDQPSRILARFDRPRSKVPAWHYRARGDIDDFAESDDGTIFLSVQTHPRLSAARDEDGEVVVIDGRSGLEVGAFQAAAVHVADDGILRTEVDVRATAVGARVAWARAPMAASTPRCSSFTTRGLASATTDGPCSDADGSKSLESCSSSA